MFTVDYGDEEAKMKLTSLLIGISIEVLAQFQRIYMLVGCQESTCFLLGMYMLWYENSTFLMIFPADWIICKFGRNYRAYSCAKEHKRSFKRSIDVCLDKYTGSRTEWYHQRLFQIFILKHAHRSPEYHRGREDDQAKTQMQSDFLWEPKEIIAIHPGDLVLIEDIFDTVKNKCAGGIEELEGMLEQERRNTEQERQNTEQEPTSASGIEICRN